MHKATQGKKEQKPKTFFFSPPSPLPSTFFALGLVFQARGKAILACSRSVLQQFSHVNEAYGFSTPPPTAFLPHPSSMYPPSTFHQDFQSIPTSSNVTYQHDYGRTVTAVDDGEDGNDDDDCDDGVEDTIHAHDSHNLDMGSTHV